MQGVSPVSVKPVASTVGSPVRFGMMQGDLIGTVIKTVMQQSTGVPNPAKKNKSRWREFLLKNLLPTTALTILLANVDGIYRLYQLNQYQRSGRPLESVLVKREELPLLVVKPPDEAGEVKEDALVEPQEEPKPEQDAIATPTVEEMITMLREPRVIIPSSYLLQAAKSGLVKELLTPETEKLPAPGIPKWNVVLIDGTLVTAEVDTAVRDKLVTELKIPVKRSFVGWNVGWLEASLLAAFIVNTMTALLKKEEAVEAELLKEDKKRLAMIKAGRLLVAADLNISADLLKMEHVEEELALSKYGEKYRPTDVNLLKKRLAVLMSAHVLEHHLLSESPSVGAAVHLGVAAQIAQKAILELGLDKEWGSFVLPTAPTDAQKVELEKITRRWIEEAAATALASIQKYTPQQIENLRLAVVELKPPITRAEVKALLNGATVESIQSKRSLTTRLVGKVWRPKGEPPQK